MNAVLLRIPVRISRILGLLSFTGMLLVSAIVAIAADPYEGIPDLRWWKGNLHTHSLWSDGDDFPEMIAQWYRDQGYHFLALSDHNVLSQGIRWMKVDDIQRRAGNDAMRKYESRFGGGWVEVRRNSDDEPEVRLKPFDEYRALVEERGRFILIPSEEISDRAEGKPVHINAANIAELVQPQGGATVREAIANNFRAILEQEKAKGREILPHLNHPNFGWAVTAEDLAFVTTDRFYEVYNGHPGVNHLGDETRPSVERIWDIANTIRLLQLNAEPLFGLGTDDTHHYHGTGGSRPGRGWVMVRSRYLSPEHLIRAMKQGDFYASSGVVLEDVAFDSRTRTLSLRIVGQNNATYQTRFIGTKAQRDAPESQDVALPPSEQIGMVLSTSASLTPKYQLAADDLYVRAVVTSSVPATDPSFEDQQQQAWTQPVGWNVQKR